MSDWRQWLTRWILQRNGQSATFMYMSSVGVAQLRQNLSKYLRRVEEGERLVVTDHNRPVALLGPLPEGTGALARLVEEGRVTAPAGRGLPDPIAVTGDPHALSMALEELRDLG